MRTSTVGRADEAGRPAILEITVPVEDARPKTKAQTETANSGGQDTTITGGAKVTVASDVAQVKMAATGAHARNVTT